MSGGRKKKKRVQQQPSESSDSDPAEVQVDFEAFPLTDGDYGGITALLKQLFGHKTELDLPGLADTMIKQSPLGSVLKPSIDEDSEVEIDDDVVFGVTTVLDLSQKEGPVSALAKQLKTRVDKAKKKNAGSQLKVLKDALADLDRPLGFIINERMLNIPHRVSLPSLKSLLEDMIRGAKRWKDLDRFLLLVKIHAQVGDSTLPPVFANAEEELLAEGYWAQENESWAEWGLEEGEGMHFEDAAFASKRRLCFLSKAQLLRYVHKMEQELA